MKSNDINNFYIKLLPDLYKDSDFVRLLLPYAPLLKVKPNNSEKETFNQIFMALVQEAEVSLSLIEDLLDKKLSVLEVGGGIGLCYGYLKSQGYNITSIEPSSQGYDSSYKIAQKLFKILKISSECWYPYTALEVGKLEKNFDIIFSNNVMEHIKEIDKNFSALSKVLKHNGVMIHNTVNYHVPYEPHLGIVLLPFFPSLTYLLNQKLKQSILWNDLNFITASKIYSLCRDNNLKVKFDKNVLFKTINRLDSDKHFATRHPSLVPIFWLFKTFHVIELTKYFPPALMTPIKFSVYNK